MKPSSNRDAGVIEAGNKGANAQWREDQGDIRFAA